MNARPGGAPAPRGVVLDTDGVLLDSAAVHAAAWKRAFDACLAQWAEGGAAPDASAPRPPAPAPSAPTAPTAPSMWASFDADADYRRYVDGRSRFDGAGAFLAARGIRLPPGRPDDPPGCDTVRAVAARKEAAFQDALAAAPLVAFEDAPAALTRLRALGVPCAAVSASRHARELIHATGLAAYLTAIVDGADAARLGLAGKPDPALFLHAAGLLGTRPGDTAVVEDALAGVRAGHRGGFGIVAGVDRTPDGHGTAALREHGADLVVPDLTTLVRRVWGERG